MTGKLTREQRLNEVKELIANAEEWAGYYEHPIHDKPQREMFEGMARVMAEHLAALIAESVEPGPALVVSEIDRRAITGKVYRQCCRIPGATFYNAAEFTIDEVEALLKAGNSLVIPDGYVIVPKQPTERMVIDGFESEPDETFSEPEVWEAFQKMSGCEQAAYRARLCWAAMLAAAPPAPKQENI
ncbi:TPA: hypothetical protein OUE41_003680 [Klebsiella pneumoniae]|uniref:hypothetical protein n=1 Tax=Klebsiella pneumoniae complex TaxID=3390273 RepID=UPI000D744E56|nr:MULTISPECIES: hypothetical protein [Klebsiella]HCI4222365.1 hypothetical protein [Klebsiella quasipneumoniae subsp. quasipneumoniae]PXL12490.1 hypothetical protein DMS22_05350 [Klebsiella variicola]SXQ20781.1 Uncharacterised protein [Klebsiella pneumoniae]HCI6834876.1 hypothetical protein [Klebsiella quasipneumoniae subsp. quasipneumoniae]HCU0234688.1 hypothetical protein [Klebsiella pneumoniae]